MPGVATHWLSRIITKDWVTIPVRAPFTRYRKSLPGGEVLEESRGKGLRRAVDDLPTCQFCIGPWVAGALAAGLVAATLSPRRPALRTPHSALKRFLPLVAIAPVSLPRPAARHFDLERQTQECPHQHDGRKHPDALEGEVKGNRSDDVGPDEYFQPEQDRSSDSVPRETICCARIPALQEDSERGATSCERADHDDHYTQTLENDYGDLRGFVEHWVTGVGERIGRVGKAVQSEASCSYARPARGFPLQQIRNI